MTKYTCLPGKNTNKKKKIIFCIYNNLDIGEYRCNDKGKAFHSLTEKSEKVLPGIMPETLGQLIKNPLLA